MFRPQRKSMLYFFAFLVFPTDPSTSMRLDKRSDAVFPQIEDDVSELDQLRNEPTLVNKRQHDGGSTVRTTTTTTKESVEKVIAAPEAGSSSGSSSKEQLPDLERQLEVATPLMSMSTTTTTSTSATTTTAAFKDESERSQLEEPKIAAKPELGAHGAKVSSLRAGAVKRNEGGGEGNNAVREKEK